MADLASSIEIDRPRYDDHPEFMPDISPGKMLSAGVFGGGYFYQCNPEDLEGIDEKILRQGSYDKIPSDRHNNAFGAKSGLSRQEWIEKGWMRDQDPLGWFQWYCRFHSGRRSPDDERQITRWADFKKRWQPKTKEALERMNPGAGTRQALLHWGIDPWLPENGLKE